MIDMQHFKFCFDISNFENIQYIKEKMALLDTKLF